jgi:hypothetical protein
MDMLDYQILNGGPLQRLFDPPILSTMNFAVNVIFGGNVWITGKLRGDQNITVIAFRELIIFLCLVDL